MKGQCSHDPKSEWCVFCLQARVRELEEEVTKLRQWVNDLQSGMYVNCVYCGHRYGPNETTSITTADAPKTHIETVPRPPHEHPPVGGRKAPGLGRCGGHG